MMYVVNIVPYDQSDLTGDNSEPTLAVNPANPAELAATVFTPDTDPAGHPLGFPLYYSSNGGCAWAIRDIIPGRDPSGSPPVFGDATLSLTNSGSLYVATARKLPGQDLLFQNNISRAGPGRLSGADPAILTVIDNISPHGLDQPWLVAATAWANTQIPGGDHVFLGGNADDSHATVLALSNGAAAPPVPFRRFVLDDRGRLTYPATRIASVGNGTIYAAFFSLQSLERERAIADLVLVRDGHWGELDPGFQDLRDPRDGHVGVRAVTGITLPGADEARLGRERVLSELALAADSSSDDVWIAWGEGRPQAGDYRLRLGRSRDGGQTWTLDILIIPNATNPCLAVTHGGTVGFLYQAFDSANSTWQTIFARSSDGRTFHDLTLARTANATDAGVRDPFLGDYASLLAVEDDFYGVFCAVNDPVRSNFPQGITYQRRVDWVNRQLLHLDGTPGVQTSVDPFFFRTLNHVMQATVRASVDALGIPVVAGGIASCWPELTDVAPGRAVAYSWSVSGAGAIVGSSTDQIVRVQTEPEDASGRTQPFEVHVTVTDDGCPAQTVTADLEILPWSSSEAAFRRFLQRYRIYKLPAPGPDPQRRVLAPDPAWLLIAEAAARAVSSATRLIRGVAAAIISRKDAEKGNRPPE